MAAVEGEKWAFEGQKALHSSIKNKTFMVDPRAMTQYIIRPLWILLFQIITHEKWPRLMRWCRMVHNRFQNVYDTIYSYLRWALQTPDEHETPSFGQSPAQSSPVSTNCLYFCSNWHTRSVSCWAKLWKSPPQLCFCVAWIKRPGMATGEEVMHLLKWLERRSRSCKMEIKALWELTFLVFCTTLISY